ncbi:hypothetical protein, partial [Sphingobium bisphenolivorans]|uniref:hypothetical protein n=1 Tax=Sphingobium bisphenolivorans TaxID=1335760 RepID=UPI001EE75824
RSGALGRVAEALRIGHHAGHLHDNALQLAAIDSQIHRFENPHRESASLTAGITAGSCREDHTSAR